MSYAVVELKDILVMGRHGVLETEKLHEQAFAVSVWAELDASGAVKSDSISETLDYSALAALVVKIVSRQSFDLLERLCFVIASEVMEAFSPREVRVKVKKLHPPMDVSVAYAAVEMTLARGEA